MRPNDPFAHTDTPAPADDPLAGMSAAPALREKGSSSRWLLVLAVLLFLGGAASGGLWYYLGHAAAAPLPEPAQPEAKRKELAKNLLFETQGDVRRVIVQAVVCYREGQLEGLMCKRNTKEHEYILTADVDARLIHTALIAAGAREGTPVQFQPKYVPASGSTIKISLRYEKGGKMVTVPAQDWIQDMNTRKPLAESWVFGGSKLVPDPDNPQQQKYMANYGDVICVCNMDTAMLDLPIRSPKRFDDRVFHAFTERIPALGTKVEVILEPVPEKKPEKPPEKKEQ
jgi:hypothetical protein